MQAKIFNCIIALCINLIGEATDSQLISYLQQYQIKSYFSVPTRDASELNSIIDNFSSGLYTKQQTMDLLVGLKIKVAMY
jgi:hypothetical protein